MFRKSFMAFTGEQKSNCKIKIFTKFVPDKISNKRNVTPSIMTLSITTFSIKTFSIMTFSILTFSIMTFSIMTFSIMTFSIMTLSIKSLFTILSIHDTQHNNNAIMLSFSALSVALYLLLCCVSLG